MATHQATEPLIVRAYFGPDPERPHAIVTKVFREGRGWVSYPVCKRVSGAWARQARAEGITHVALTVGARTADFRIEELTARRRKA